MKIEKDCPCGNKFYLTPGQVRPGHGKFCSRPCYYKYRKNFPLSELSKKMKGSNHWNYKGNNAGYSAFHLRVQAKRGKAKECDFCGRKSWVEWANLLGYYEDVNDYLPLCRSCHKNYDNQIIKSQEVSVFQHDCEGGESAR